jgi:hypothetical protein
MRFRRIHSLLHLQLLVEMASARAAWEAGRFIVLRFVALKLKKPYHLPYFLFGKPPASIFHLLVLLYQFFFTVHSFFPPSRLEPQLSNTEAAVSPSGP